MSGAAPVRGEIWLANFSPHRGREQTGERPALIVSADTFNRGGAELVVAVPCTTTERPVRFHVRIAPPEAGVRKVTFVMCEAVRSMSKDRLIERWGRVNLDTLREVEDRIRVLLSL